MSSDSRSSGIVRLDHDGPVFLLRWRGKQEGPYTEAAIEARLAANQIGLLHEICRAGQWMTLRDYFAERDAMLQAQLRAREIEEQQMREFAEQQAKENEEQQGGEMPAEERRKKDLLATNLVERDVTPQPTRPTQVRKSHRGGTLLALGVVGLLVCGPFCIAAWVMADSDLREMDAGIMDDGGRSSTSSARSLGICGTVLWIIGVIVFFVIHM